jgi:dihydroxy-acid dehydratase
VKNELTLALPAKEIAARKKAWKPRKPKETRGTLAKYAKLVTSASEGAVTDKNL